MDLVSQPSDHRFRIMAGRHHGRDGCFSAGRRFPGDEDWALEALGSLDCISPSRILLHITCISSQTLKNGDVGSSFDPNPRQSLFPQLISNCKPDLGRISSTSASHAGQGRMTSLYLPEIWDHRI